MSSPTTENAELQGLIQLQQIDLRIMELKEKAARIPDEIQELDQRLEEIRQNSQQARQQIEDEGKALRQFEGNVETLKERLSKFKTQLMDVKTNKEYQAMLHEIQETESRISEFEDLILEKLLLMDDLDERAGQTQEALEKREAEILKERREMEEFGHRFEAEIEELSGSRQQLAATLRPDLVELYTRISTARNGVALAEVKNQSCQSCHVRLRPQLFAELKTNHQILTCESCNRILYYVGS